jgi:hypothetical protein
VTRLLVCTGDELVVLEGEDGDWAEPRPALAAGGAQCVAVDANDSDRLLVGAMGGGAQVSLDGGGSWRRAELPENDVLSVAISAADGTLYAGTEPSRVFHSPDGERWEELTALQEIPSRQSWRFPPRPWTSHVRWIAPDPHAAERLLVGIELGGLMYSEDGGKSFTDHRPGAQRDVHCLAWHPRVGGRAYEAAGGGAAWSSDGGLDWEPADEGRRHDYCWALAADPVDPDTWFVSAASGPGRAHGRGAADADLYRWHEAGPWERIGTGLPEPLDSMVYALAAGEDGLFAALRDGRILHSSNRGESFEQLPVGTEQVLALALSD